MLKNGECSACTQTGSFVVKRKHRSIKKNTQPVGSVGADRETGCVYSIGMNSYGQCGVDSEKNLLFFPLTFKQRITKVAAGLYHSAFVDELGVLYTCGRNVEGQLGIQSQEKNSPDVKQPQKVNIKWPIESIACGN
jgi:alpha-tubulin suppressor-like RCC1 family protein